MSNGVAGELGNPTTYTVVRESLIEEMTSKPRLKNKEGGVGSLGGGSSRSTGPEVGKHSAHARTMTFSPLLEHLGRCECS